MLRLSNLYTLCEQQFFKSFTPNKILTFIYFFFFVYCTGGFYCRHVASHPYGISESSNHTQPERLRPAQTEPRVSSFRKGFFAAVCFVRSAPYYSLMAILCWLLCKKKKPHTKKPGNPNKKETALGF